MISRRIDVPRFPFPDFPDSWYAVAWSSEVPVGSAVPLRAFGQELVAFRSADGVVHVLAARCPHLGAHLGHGGVVIDDQLRCPFHGWAFAADGRLTAAPRARKLPVCKPLRTWTTHELHDRIWIWFSEDDAPPAWTLPAVVLPGARWSTAGRIDRTFASHPQDIIENAVDALHFESIHGMTEVLDTKTTYDEHRITTRLHCLGTSDRFGFPGLVLTADILVEVYGLGLQTIRTVVGIAKLGLSIETMVVEGLVPREAGSVSLLIDVHMARLPVPGATRLARRSFLDAVVADVDADIQIWAHRDYLAQPLLTSADGEIDRYRRWARRFYPQPTP